MPNIISAAEYRATIKKRLPVKRRLEQDLVSPSCKLLKLRGFKTFQQRPPLRTGKGGERFVPSWWENGTPDLFVARPRWMFDLDHVRRKVIEMVAVEFKAKNGRLSESQRAFRDWWEDRGGRYIVARCLLDLERI